MSEQTYQDAHGNAHHDEGLPHIVSPRIYVIVGLTLLALTATTAGVSYIELGVFNAVVALAIAVLKAMLVVLFFMHLKYSARLTKLTVLCGIFVFLGLISMMLADYMSRAWGRW
ncbi:MAG: cytochrome C oxidase subunit IV family protein [Terracidiphilus sp.]